MREVAPADDPLLTDALILLPETTCQPIDDDAQGHLCYGYVRLLEEGRALRPDPAFQPLGLWPSEKEISLARTNYQFEKRKKELARKKKNEEKRERKLAKKTSPTGEILESAPGDEETVQSGPPSPSPAEQAEPGGAPDIPGSPEDAVK